MRSPRGIVACTLLLLAAGRAAGQDLEAQATAPASGGGGFFDWIHKLSGPGFQGFGVSGVLQPMASRGRVPPRFRLEAVSRRATNKGGRVVPEVDITMKTVQGTVEITAPVRIPVVSLYGATGVAHHTFSGDAFTDFSHWSIPFTAGLSSRTSILPFRGFNLIPRVAFSVHYMPAFDADDFSPIFVNVKRSGAEWIKQFRLMLDLTVPF